MIENSGKVTLAGGKLFFDHTSSSAGIVPLGGSTIVRDVSLTPQGTNGIGNLVSLSDAVVASGVYGRVAFHNSPYDGGVGGTPVMKGDVLAYGPTGLTFAPRLGRQWAAEHSGTTIANSVVGNARSVTCTTLTTGSPIIGIYAPLSYADWRLGEKLYLLIVYKATKTATFRVASSVLGTPLASFGTLPGTAGKVVTAFQLNIDSFSTSGSPVIEIFLEGTAAVNDNITLYEAFIADSRQTDATVGAFGNLFKC